MKKLLSLLLILLMVFTLVGCSSKEETSAAQELEQQEIIEKIEEEIDIVGGYVDAEDGTLTDELKDIFSKALEDLTGAKYEPVKLVATQVVAGINYKFLANGTKTTNPITKGTYYIIIYKDLQDNVKLLDIEVIEEKQEVVKEETKKEIDPEVLKTYKYWVVFFDQDGNELQREAIKWGTTPSYWSGTPYYEDGEHWYRFTGWKDRWGRDVKEFKPITGNTRFYAQYEIGGDVYHGGGGSNTPAPDPEYEQLTCLTTAGTPNPAYINSKVTASDNMKFVFKAKMKSGVWSEPFGYWIKYGPGNFGGLLFQPYWNNASAYSYEIYLGKRTGYPSGGNTDFGLNQESIFEFQIKQNDNYLKVNGTILYSDTLAVDGVEPADIYVFAQNNYSSGATISANAFTIYYFQIYKNGSLVRDFIPVKTVKVIDKSKNANDNLTDIPADTLCMYDKVNGMYYLNLGSTPFTTDPIN